MMLIRTTQQPRTAPLTPASAAPAHDLMRSSQTHPAMALMNEAIAAPLFRSMLFRSASYISVVRSLLCRAQMRLGGSFYGQEPDVVLVLLVEHQLHGTGLWPVVCLLGTRLLTAAARPSQQIASATPRAGRGARRW